MDSGLKVLNIPFLYSQKKSSKLGSLKMINDAILKSLIRAALARGDRKEALRLERILCGSKASIASAAII